MADHITDRQITVFLADDNLIVREGVRALLGLEADITVVGAPAHYDGLVSGAEAAAPQVVVTDIRMPPSFQQEGIDAAKEVRKRHPGTGVIVLSQYDDPEYAISLLAEGSAGYAYLSRTGWRTGTSWPGPSVRVATGGSLLDPSIAQAMVNRWRRPAEHCKHDALQCYHASWSEPRYSSPRPKRAP